MILAALAAPAPVTGFAGKGQLLIGTSLGGAKIALSGDIALESRGQRLRIDLLDLAIPGTGSVLSALVSTQLIPPGGFTVVYDRTASTYTVWSSAKPVFYVGGGSGPQAAPPAGGAGAALGAGSDLFGAFGFARSLKDDSAFTISLALVGHSVVNGHPTSGVDYRYARTTTAGDATDVHGRLQLADDLDEVPVELTADVASKSIPESTLQLDLTALAKQPVPERDFAVPAGYTRIQNLGDVLGKTLSF